MASVRDAAVAGIGPERPGARSAWTLHLATRRSGGRTSVRRSAGWAGLMGLPDGTPSHWPGYFQVADVDAAVTAAEGAGGRVVAPAFDSPFGRAALADLDGAVFMVMSVDPSRPAPDRSG